MSKVIFLTLLSLLTIQAIPQAKIEPQLLKSLISKKATNIIVSMPSTLGVLSQFNNMSFASRDERLNAVAGALQSFSQVSQAPLITMLKAQGASYDSYWNTNQASVKNANPILVQMIQSVPGVNFIEEEKIYPIPDAFIDETQGEVPETRQSGVQWGIAKVEAQAVWNAGNQGQGTIVANIDTGVRGTHEILAANFVGNYGWFDPSKTSVSRPTDVQGHGTHTMGTICGTKGYGVAPQAKWMACRGCTANGCSSSDLLACARFIQCPTLTDGSKQDCSKAPHLVSNSWGGGQGSTWYNNAIAGWKTAGIDPIFSIGNSGSRCGTANSPGDQDVISVGSTTSSNALSGFSSRGPSTAGKLKPEISAPGDQVRSAYHSSDTAYTTMSGTSMACPHVAGVVALMHTKNSKISYDQVKQVLFSSTMKNIQQTGQNCGNIAETTFPNNAFGYGIVNAKNAIAKM